jgi:hypothetical protein
MRQFGVPSSRIRWMEVDPAPVDTIHLLEIQGCAQLRVTKIKLRGSACIQTIFLALHCASTMSLWSLRHDLHSMVVDCGAPWSNGRCASAAAGGKLWRAIPPKPRTGSWVVSATSRD